MNEVDQTPLVELVEEFQYDNEAKNLSPKTIRWYQDLLGAFLRWLDEQGTPAVLGSLGTGLAVDYIRYLKERPNRHTGKKLSTHGVHAHVRVLKVFASFLTDRGYTDANVLRGLKYPRTDPVSTRVLTDAEFERILRAAQSSGSTGFRNYCIVLTFMDTGLRLAELAGLTCEGARLNEGLLDVVGKGRRPRSVPVSARLRGLLRRYAEHYRPATVPASGEAFFVSERGTALSPNAVSLIIKRLGARAGVPRLHPHLFRHSFATVWLRENDNIETLRLILGHSDFRMVQRYVHLVDADVRIRHSHVSPVDRFLRQHPVAPPRRRGRTR